MRSAAERGPAEVSFHDEFDTWTVERRYYGEVEEDEIGWVVEWANPRAKAERIKRHSNLIDEIVARNADSGRARVSVDFDGDRMTVTEYDFGDWSETVELDS